MFYDDDEDEDDTFENLENYVGTPFENWLDYHWINLPLDLRNEPWDNIELLHFYTHVYCNVNKELLPLLLDLAEKQFPIITREFRPLIVDRINEYLNDFIERFLWHMFQLLHDQKLGVDLHEKYPKLEEWIPFYARPQKPRSYDISFFDDFPPFVTEEYKLQEIEIMNKTELEYFNKFEMLKRNFVDTVQEVVFKYYKEIFELDSDGWIMYSVIIRDEYEKYKDCFEYLDEFIFYEFPEEDINLNYTEFTEKRREICENRPDLKR